MSIVQHIKVLDSQLANIKIVAGSTIYTRDTGKHFIDISDTERVQISDIIYIDTDKERIALLAPLPDKLYITRDTNKVWVYSVKTDKWICLNIDTTYTAGTGISIDGTTINNSGVRAVTAGASANKININTNDNINTITIDNVANAVSASKATSDSVGQQINTTYIKGLSVSGKVITYTKGDGTTGTITTQDTDTWRGIQNVLTSDSTTDSLSAAQGKALKGLVDGKADKATTLSDYGITDAKISDGVITLGANSITPLTAHQSLAAYAKTADVNTALDKKANKATTLSGYGITDAKISDGTITLGSNTITPLTNHQSLANYYTKSSVDTLIANLKAGLVNVVESLPTTGENGKLYLVKTGSESENLYSEYVYVNKAWEKLGTQELDLSGYLTKTDAANTYLGKTAAAASANKLNTNGGSATQPIYFANGVPVATTYTLGKSVPSDAKFTDTVYNHPTTHPASMITGLSTVATSGSYSDLSNKPTIPVVPTKVSAFINDAGYLTQHQSLDDYAKKTDVNTALANKLGINDTAAAAIKDDAGNNIAETYAKFGTANTWTAQQNFDDLMLYREKYTTYGVNGTSFTPTVSTIRCTATGAFTLNLATLVEKLSSGQSSVLTAYFAANADYSLTITNAGTIKYIGSASDVAITSAGLLLNILMMKDSSGNLTSIVQASKLS